MSESTDARHLSADDANGEVSGEQFQILEAAIHTDGSLNSYGADEARIRTPHVDRLAKAGRRFTDANTPSSV